LRFFQEIIGSSLGRLKHIGDQTGKYASDGRIPADLRTPNVPDMA